MAGFGPTNNGVKVRCLTAWRHPNINEKERNKNEKPEGDQGVNPGSDLYSSSFRFILLVMGWIVGFEPTASRATIWRANQLRHTHHIAIVWCARRDSNP